jgi:hypothetical protein
MTKTRRKKKKRKRKTYKKKEYDSGDGMLTKIWGPSLWHYLHVMSFNYPVRPTKKDKKHYKLFLCQLRHVLPCGKCRKNLTTNLKKLPPTSKVLKNRNTFSKYIYNLHELINKMLNKKSNLSYEQVRDRHEHFRARCISVKVGKAVEKNKTRKKKEDGCVEPLYKGKKSKCIIKIVPQETKCKTFQMDNKCKKTRILG